MADDEKSPSIMDDMYAFSTGFELDRKINSFKGDKWTPELPIESHMKKRIDGLWVWSPTAPDDPWVQSIDSLPPTTAALFKLESSQGDLDISQTYPHKDLWDDYVTCNNQAHLSDATRSEGRGFSIMHIAASNCTQISIMHTSLLSLCALCTQIIVCR